MICLNYNIPLLKTKIKAKCLVWLRDTKEQAEQYDIGYDKNMNTENGKTTKLEIKLTKLN